NIEEYQLNDGRKIYLLAEGRLVNLAAGDGHPAEIMDMTFALQAVSLEYLNNHYTEVGNKVLSVPYELDQQVAAHKLDALGITIDALSGDQQAYLASWK